jgi:hypothetical protein
LCVCAVCVFLCVCDVCVCCVCVSVCVCPYFLTSMFPPPLPLRLAHCLKPLLQRTNIPHTNINITATSGASRAVSGPARGPQLPPTTHSSSNSSKSSSSYIGEREGTKKEYRAASQGEKRGEETVHRYSILSH